MAIADDVPYCLFLRNLLGFATADYAAERYEKSLLAFVGDSEICNSKDHAFGRLFNTFLSRQQSA
jgi:hypothetical protein